MEFKQDITIKEQIDLSPLTLFLSIERLKWQVGRIVSDAESEEGTISRMTKILKDDITTLEKDLKTVLYNPDNGLIIKIDRLTQESISRKQMKNNIIGLWIAVAAGIAVNLFNWLFKK